MDECVLVRGRGVSFAFQQNSTCQTETKKERKMDRRHSKFHSSLPFPYPQARPPTLVFPLGRLVLNTSPCSCPDSAPCKGSTHRPPPSPSPSPPQSSSSSSSSSSPSLLCRLWRADVDRREQRRVISPTPGRKTRTEPWGVGGWWLGRLCGIERGCGCMLGKK